MFTRRPIAIVSMLALLLASAVPAAAGGWATIELERPLSGVIAGKEIAVPFMILQHGVTPAGYERVQVTATHAESETEIVVLAEPSSVDGHYVARLTFSEAGRWNLEAEELAYGFRSSFPTLVVLASADGDESESTGSATSEAEEPAAIVDVEIINTGFVPALIEIKAGTTVRWTNQDPIKHEIAFVDLKIDDSGIIDERATFTFTFDTPGDYTFACGPHPGMSGKIEVR